MKESIDTIRAELDGLDEVNALLYLSKLFENRIVFSTSFGWEDQVISHLIFKNDIPVKVFTLETGRLFPETFYVWNRTLEIYEKPIHAYYPNTQHVENFVSAKGPNSFYESVSNRQECCRIRKIEPLRRALDGQKCWVTGIRAEQSNNRQGMDFLEWDEQNQLIKFHPLFNWSLDRVKDFIRSEHIVYNPLHDKGFPSIGCQPCTRAVAPGEDFRAGRWWWEDQSKKECGLHSVKS